jgi:uncharacterized membrane protein
MAKRKYWSSFAAGAAAGAAAGFGSWLLARVLRREEHQRVVRVEKSVQVGRPIEEVFRAWSNLEQLPAHLRDIEELRTLGNRSRWKVRINGKRFEWEAEVTQRVENQALGWKSVRGPKHTGRINFSPLGNDTEVHVVLNYAPPLGILGRALAESTAYLDWHIERALRDFKAALEGKGQEKKVPSGVAVEQETRATGTFGQDGTTQTARFGGDPNPVEDTRPPQAKP